MIHRHLALSHQNELLESDSAGEPLSAVKEGRKIGHTSVAISHKSIFSTRHFGHILLVTSHLLILTKFESELAFMMISWKLKSNFSKIVDNIKIINEFKKSIKLITN